MNLDVISYLESKDLVVKPAGSGNVRVLCPFHGEEEGKPGRLYINTEGEKNGLLFCFICNVRGTINKLRKFYGDEPVNLNVDDRANPLMEIAAAYYHDKLFSNLEAYDYLVDKRGLTDVTIVQARIGWADGGLVNHLISKGYTTEQIKESGLANHYGNDYFKDEIIFPYQQFGRAIQIRGKKINGITRGLPGVQTMPYGLDSILGEVTVVCTEGEIDCLTMQQLGYNAIGLPGVHTFKDEWLEFLEDAKRIYIVFDADSAGKSGAEKLASKVGQRARIVELPKKGLDVNDWFVKYGKQKEDFDYLFSKSKGGLLVTVNQAYDKWLEVEGGEGIIGLRFNIPDLDKNMNYGLLPGQVMSMIARSSAGKTIWTINMFERMKMIKPDIKILFVSLEQSRNEWFERAYRIRNFYAPGSSVIDTVNYWKDNLLIVDKNRVTEEELRDCMDQYSYEAGAPADLTAVDYLGYYARSFPGTDEKQRTTEAIMGIKSLAREFETVVYSPHQANRTGELGKKLAMDMAKNSSTVEETSDLMLALWTPDQVVTEENQERSGIVLQEILKSRNGGVGQETRYQFCPLTLAMVPYQDELYDWAIKERRHALSGMTWKESVNVRLTGDVSL